MNYKPFLLAIRAALKEHQGTPAQLEQTHEHCMIIASTFGAAMLLEQLVEQEDISRAKLK